MVDYRKQASQSYTFNDIFEVSDARPATASDFCINFLADIDAQIDAVPGLREEMQEAFAVHNAKVIEKMERRRLARFETGQMKTIVLADLTDEEFERHTVQRQDVSYDLTSLDRDRTMRFFASIPLDE